MSGYQLRSKKPRTGESILSSLVDTSLSARVAEQPVPPRAAMSYRDIVAASSPPPLGGVKGPLGPSETRTPSAFARVAVEPSDSGDSETSLSKFTERDNDNGNPWVLVKPRKTRSLESLNKRNIKVNFLAKESQKTQGNDPMIEAAKRKLTAEQRAHIRKRDAVMQNQRDESSSRGEGPSQVKGKGPDPQNWGS